MSPDPFSGVVVAMFRELPDGRLERVPLEPSPEPAKRQAKVKPWSVIKAPGGCGNVYTHTSGWQVKHCGHPTALYPYSVHDLEGRMHLHPNGRAFQYLKDAKAYVERQVAREVV